MKIDFTAIFSKKENIISTLLVLAVIIFIAFLFPTTGRFNLEYKKGEVWKYDDLLAPFEYPVLKDPEEVNSIKKNINSEFVPYFKRTELAGKIHDVITNYIIELSSDIDNSTYQTLLRYLKQNQTKILISEEELIFNEFRKDAFLISSEQGLIRLEKDQYLDIKEYYSFISSNIPREYHEELGKLITIEAEIDEEKSQYELNLAENEAIISSDTVKDGELIVSKGNLITDAVHQKMLSLEDAYAKREVTLAEGFGSFTGHIILTCLILGALMLYLHFHFPFILNSPKELSFILLWIIVFTFLVYQIEKSPSLSAYMIPFCIAPIVIKTYYEERLALFVHIVIVLIASFLSTLDYEFTFLQILAGIVTVLLIEETRYWDRFFVSILIILGTYVLGFWGLNMASSNSLGQGIETSVLKYMGVNGVLILLAYPIIPLFSKIFGFTSNISLMELSDLNKPLLKDLSISAPGTFQHSLQVSNLSEAAAEKIGANGLLIKVAALYHDIGKLTEPMIFIENVGYGRNPHEDLTYTESAKKIIDHIPEGVKLANTYGLPPEIISMIKTHHGTTRVEYFYRKQREEFPDQELNESDFTYPGPKPVTKEETILLLADSLEAASKSLNLPSAEEIDELVEEITLEKFKQGQLSESKLTYNEMLICKNVFKDLLKSINHVRVKYPEAPVST